MQIIKEYKNIKSFTKIIKRKNIIIVIFFNSYLHNTNDLEQNQRDYN